MKAANTPQAWKENMARFIQSHTTDCLNSNQGEKTPRTHQNKKTWTSQLIPHPNHPMYNHTQSNSLISICSLNVNHSNTATHAAMYIIVENKLPPFGIFLVQEPQWEKISQEYKTVAFTGWQTILPKHPVQDTERPRVAAYYRLGQT